jgi:hypothetical protein
MLADDTSLWVVLSGVAVLAGLGLFVFLVLRDRRPPGGP